MSGSGLISIGSHTDSHPVLTRCSADRAKDELWSSKQIIEERTGLDCTLFSYPPGQPSDFDEGTKTAVAELGFSCGAAAIGGLNTAASDPFELRRVGVDNRDHLADFIWNMSELRWVSRDIRSKVLSQ